nr:recombinase family protein [Streptomyces sp. S1D4-11]
MSRSKLAKAAIAPGEPAAIYCRISHTKDEDQTGVDRQERICREIAEGLQFRVEAAHVYVDNNRSAWQRNRKRPGWEEMLRAMGEGEIRQLVTTAEGRPEGQGPRGQAACGQSSLRLHGQRSGDHRGRGGDRPRGLPSVSGR